MAEAPVVSHGRGGAGNVAPDDTKYVDGTIHREEDPAASGGAYSTGRGGGGNIASPKLRPVSVGRPEDVVPEVTKVRTNDNGAYHTGRGGEGNTHPAPATAPGEKAAKSGKSLVERIKEKITAILGKKKAGTTAPVTAS